MKVRHALIETVEITTNDASPDSEWTTAANRLAGILVGDRYESLENTTRRVSETVGTERIRMAKLLEGIKEM